MLASVSPESYRAIINGQSDWGIFPLLLDFSIIKDLGATVFRSRIQAIGRSCKTSAQRRHGPKIPNHIRRSWKGRYCPASAEAPDGRVVTSTHLLSENTDK